MNHICKYCNAELKSISELNNHTKNDEYCIQKQYDFKFVLECKNNKIFQCKTCDKQLSTKQSLQRHLKICKDKLLQCEFCEESLSGQNNLIIHLSRCYKRFEKTISKLQDENI